MLGLISCLLLACAGGGAGPAPTGGGALDQVVGGGMPVGTNSAATGDVMGAKSDGEVLPAGRLRTNSACLAELGTAGSSKISIPEDGVLKFLFQANFDVDSGYGGATFTLGCGDSKLFSSKGVPIRVVWSSEKWTEPKYRDFLVEDTKDGVNLTIDDIRPAAKDRLDIYFYDESYYVTRLLDGKADEKYAIDTYFMGPYLPPGTPHDAAPPAPSKEWKVVSSEDLADFTNLKNWEGDSMVHHLGQVEFLFELATPKFPLPIGR